MDTNRLRQFKVVAETGNLREAAGLLRITHPGLSKSLRVLESDLGVRLLTKDGRGIRVTPEGRALLGDLEQCLAAEERLRQRAGRVETERTQRLKIGTFEVFSTYLSPELVSALPAGSAASFAELIPGELEEALIAGSVDVGITYIPIPKRELDHLEVGRVRMGIFGQKKFLSSSRRFEELPFVIPLAKVEGAPNKVRGLDGWPDDRVPRMVRYSVALMETALALARDGMAVAYLPEFVAERHNRVVKAEFQLIPYPLPFKLAQTQAVYAVKRKEDEEVQGFKALCRVLRSLK